MKYVSTLAVVALALSGCKGTPEVIEVEPNKAPVAMFSLALNDSTVNFINKSADADGDSLSYDWDFGDGASSTSESPSHDFSDGDFTVTLTVSDGELSNTASDTLTIASAPSLGSDVLSTENSLLLSSGQFSDGEESFTTYFKEDGDGSAEFEVAASVSIPGSTPEDWHVQLRHDLSVRAGQRYTVCFEAKADAGRDIMVDIDNGSPDYTTIVGGGQSVTLTNQYSSFKKTFTVGTTDSTARLLFNMGVDSGDVELDNIGVYRGEECNINEEEVIVESGMFPVVSSEGCGSAPGNLGSSNNPLSITQYNDYYVKLPNNYDSNTPYKLTFVFHHSSSDKAGIISWGERSSGLVKEGALDTSIMVFPRARETSGSGWRGWDEPMFEPLYNKITSELCVDKSRVFALGYSSGGDITSVIGCEHGDKLTAIVPVATKNVSGFPLNVNQRQCRGQVSSIVVHGIKDSAVGAQGGPATADFYRELSHCSSESDPIPGYTDGLTNCVKYRDCDPGGEVSFCYHGNSAYNGTYHGYPPFTGKIAWDYFSSF